MEAIRAVHRIRKVKVTHKCRLRGRNFAGVLSKRAFASSLFPFFFLVPLCVLR
jgi:hypothetical protein